MNHYTAFQPPHLDGRWQYAILNKRGGGPICGCELNEGHETREEAERHFWLTETEQCRPHAWTENEVLRRCEKCETFTDQRLGVRVNHLHDDVHVMCAECAAPFLGVSPVEAVRDFVPFRPGVESFGTL